MSSFITTIGGKRCTAIPKNGGRGGASSSSTTTSSKETPPPIETTASAAPPIAVAPAIEATSEATTSSTSTTVPPAAAASTTTTADVIPPETTPAVPAVPTSTTETSQEVPPETTPDTSPETTPEATSETPAAAAAATSAAPTNPPLAAIPDSDPSITSATVTSITADSSTSTTSSVVAQSELGASETQLTAVLSKTTLSSTIPTSTSDTTAPAESSASAGISPTPKSRAGPVVGGVMGGVALVGIIFFLFWQYKKRRGRDSLLTPLTPPTAMGNYEKYQIDNESLGPTARAKVWMGQAGGFFGKVRNGIADTGASIRMKFGRESTPSVNMNRGNSQFIEAIPQHSRSNSTAMSASQGSHITARDRFGEWWTRFTEDVNFNWRLRNVVGKKSNPADTFRISENRMTTDPNNPDFSSFLALKESELRDAANRRRDSLTASQSQLGSLGLDFSSSRADDPFADPPSNQKPNIPIITPGAEVVTLNPFVDPPSSVPAPKPANYVADIRRSRGQSVSNTAPASRLPSTFGGPESRYPSTIHTDNSHDSFRSSTLSMNPRKKAGRSDPFDLDMLMFTRPEYPTQLATVIPRNSGLSRISQSPTSSMGGVNGSMLDVAGGNVNGMQPRVVSVQAGKARIVSETGTYSSKYSSGASRLLSEWGDPGPDLGPGGLARLESQMAVGEGRSPTANSQGVTEDDGEVNQLRRAGSIGSGQSVGRAL